MEPVGFIVIEKDTVSFLPTKPGKFEGLIDAIPGVINKVKDMVPGKGKTEGTKKEKQKKKKRIIHVPQNQVVKVQIRQTGEEKRQPEGSPMRPQGPTTLTGSLTDQSALTGVINALVDLRQTVLSVELIEPGAGAEASKS